MLQLLRFPVIHCHGLDTDRRPVLGYLRLCQSSVILGPSTATGWGWAVQCGSAGAVLEDSEDSTWEAREGLAVEWLLGVLVLGLGCRGRGAS